LFNKQKEHLTCTGKIIDLHFAGTIYSRWLNRQVRSFENKNEVANRSECGVAMVNGKLYLIGREGGEFQSAESFDPKTLMWTKLTPASFSTRDKFQDL
jgi:hypothetical protein